MTDETVTQIAEFNFPFKKHVTLKNVEYDNGSNWLRVTIREQRRFTIFDLDPVSAADFGAALSDWAEQNKGQAPT
ncbi:MAG TPA: hypothetical protein ENJ91_03345 [Rhodobacteraceae bacterium]|nr:hypothetical protein [Paracoccaceae bacterium]